MNGQLKTCEIQLTTRNPKAIDQYFAAFNNQSEVFLGGSLASPELKTSEPSPSDIPCLIRSIEYGNELGGYACLIAVEVK